MSRVSSARSALKNLRAKIISQMAVKIPDAPIISRRDVARQVKDRAAGAAYGPWMDDLRRAILTPTQKAIAELLAEDTLLRGFWSVCYARLEDLVFDMAGEPPRVNLSANDLSPALKQLDAMHLVRSEFGVRAGWYVLVMPSSGWNVQWHRPASRRAVRWMHLDGLRRAAAPFLPSFAPDADLYDALARAVPSASANSDARVESGIETVSEPRRSFSVQSEDAPSVPPMAGRGALPPRHSEIRNANLPAKARGVPKVGMQTDRYARARCNWNLEIGIENLQLKIASDASRDELEKIKVALNDGDVRQFCAAARLVISARDWDDGREDHPRGDGGKWRNRFNDRASRSLAVAVMLDCVEQENFSGAAAEDLWSRWGGGELDDARWKNLRNLFQTIDKQ